MAKVNNDFPLNPSCSNPSVAGRKLSDKWYVYFYYHTTHKRKQYKVYGGLNDKSDTLAQRKAKAQKAREELFKQLTTRTFSLNTGVFEKTVAETDLLTDLVVEYLEKVKPKLAYHTYANYNTVFTQYLAFSRGITLSQISKEQVKDFFRSLTIKPQSKRSYRAYLSVFFNWLIEERKAPISNPTIGLRIEANHAVERHRVYTKEELQRIVEYCDSRGDTVLKSIIYLVYGAQVRISEILRLRIKYFRLNENKIVLPKGEAKIKTRAKTVLLDQPLREYLESLSLDYDDPQLQDKYFIGIDRNYGKSRFGTSNPLSKNTIDSRFQVLKRALCIPEHKTLYSLKHTGNVNLILSGADLIELMYKNGHTKLSQTETYARQLIEQVPEVKYVRKSREDFEFS